MDTADGAAATTCAFLRIGVGSVARHQLTLALALDCRLVLCIARGFAPEIAELQQVAEKAGARFQLVSGARAVAGLVTVNDELVVIADALLASQATAIALIEAGPAVLVQPVERGTAAGFERVDINHASAGLMRIPGRLVERLSELPPDCDVASALTRIALQGGIAQRALPSAGRDGFTWLLVRDEAEAHRIETGWIGLQVLNDGPVTAGAWLARLVVTTLGPALLHAGNGGNVLAIGALAIALLALGAGWSGLTAVALAGCAVAWVMRRTAGLLLRIERESQGKPGERWSREAMFGWLLDAVIIAILAWSPQNPVWASAGQRLFGPVMLIGVLHLVPRLQQGQWAAWFRDRSVCAALLAIASASAVLIPAMQVLAPLVVLLGIVLPMQKGAANASLTMRR